MPAILHVAAAEMQTGRVWDEETAFEDLAHRFGEEEATALVADAQAAGTHLPATVKAWLEQTGLHSNPSVVEYVARAWRTRK